MSNIDDRLWQKPKEPKRPLRGDFTANVVVQINARPTSLWARTTSVIRRFFDMRFITKPAGIAAGVAVLAITAGTSYATLRWLQPNTQVISKVTTLQNGNKRFWLHSDACQGQDMAYPVDSYYEIRADSKITPENIRDYVNSSCEDDMLEVLFPDVIKPQPKGQALQFKPGDKQYFFPYAQLKKIAKDHIVVDTRLNGEKHTDVTLPVAKGVKVFYKGESISLADLKPGKWLTLVTFTTALDKPYATEAMAPAELDKLSENGFPRGTQVEGVIQREYSGEFIFGSQTNMGTEWTRLVKDDKSPDGWKQLIPLDGNWDNYRN